MNTPTHYYNNYLFIHSLYYQYFHSLNTVFIQLYSYYKTHRNIESRPAGKSLNIKFIELLDLFKMQDNYTWYTVCEALKSIGNIRLAISIKGMYGEGPS